MQILDKASERIKRFRKRFLDEIPFISIERARYYTEKWKETENYRNIIVKVGGYSAYFTDLGKEIQDEIISRTEHRLG